MDRSVEFSEKIKSIVVSTRIRLARNFASFPFPRKMNQDQAENVAFLAQEGLKRLDRFTKYEISKLSRDEALLLQEDYLISPALMKSKHGVAFVSSDKKLSVMVNEEDHLREQFICKGFDLYLAYDCISSIDERLGSIYDFAFDKKLGYLTACPSNLGTGMRASVMMFLPGLAWNGGLEKFLPALKEGGMTVRGAFGEGTSAQGYLYQISNERTLGVSEWDILEEMTRITMEICDKEIRAREEMVAKAETEWRDRCLRAYGTLTHCAVLTLQEFLDKIADVRLGILLGFFRCLNKDKFEEFTGDMRPTAFRVANRLQDDKRLCDMVRAETVSRALPKLVQVVVRERN
jgi:protein arginine kinase